MAAMAGDLQKRYIDVKATLHACSAMDPRFKSLPFLTENERQEVCDGLIAEAARLSMQPSELSLWSVDEEGTANASADNEGMESEEEAVDDRASDSRKERAVKVSILHPGIQGRLVHWLLFLLNDTVVVQYDPRQIPKRTRPRSR